MIRTMQAYPESSPMRQSPRPPWSVFRGTHFDLMFPLFVHSLLCFGPLLIVFHFAYNRLNLDLCQGTSESSIE